MIELRSNHGFVQHTMFVATCTVTFLKYLSNLWYLWIVMYARNHVIITA